jgi:hypothetical protein
VSFVKRLGAFMDETRFRASVLVAVGVALLMLAPAALAGKRSSVKLTGAKTVTYGQSFTIKISGYAAAPANRIVAGEQTSTATSCATKYSSEAPRADYFSDYGDTVGKNHKFKGSLSFEAAHLGSKAICAYVVNTSNGKTYAHAQFTWTNVANTPSGALEPAPVGSAECPAKSFADGSVVAQIAYVNTSCTAVVPVENGADVAKGAAYSASGFSCKGTVEGSGSPWSSAWGGTYYAYSCADGSAQVAFNWGHDYTY